MKNDTLYNLAQGIIMKKLRILYLISRKFVINHVFMVEIKHHQTITRHTGSPSNDCAY